VALNVENMALYDNLKENLLATLGALVNAIEARDSYTQQHSERVTQFAIAIAQALGHSRENLRKIESAGLLHDIGKIGIDDSILKKPGKLTKEEFERIKAHPLIGVNIVLSLGLESDELSIIRNHHERWDGRGYPDGLRQQEIPLLARILAVADAFDAMNSSRAYRQALPFPVCLRELRENSGSQFDPQVVEAALSILSP
jgi:putative nucleotidyltransferase with HDIG domain